MSEQTRTASRPSPHGDRAPTTEPLWRTALGAALRTARHEQGRTLADVARRAAVSVQYLSEVERGRKDASSEVLAAICRALRLDLTQVVAATWRELAAEPGGPGDVLTLRSMGSAPRSARVATVRPGPGDPHLLAA